MLSLSDYYQPLNLINLLFFALTFFFFDIVGFYINARFIKSKPYLRPTVWLFGMGVFIFSWFLLHFVLPLKAVYVLLLATAWLLISLPNYFRHQGLPKLAACIKQNPWPLIIIFPLLPIVFVKASLPPYYFDEMAYHYLSPADLVTRTGWDFFAGGMYQNLPKVLNSLYMVIFSVVKSYSPARLFHFTVLFTSFYSIYLWLRTNLNHLAALGFIVLYFYLPQDLIIPATLGYVDIGAVTLTTLGVVSLLDIIIGKGATNLLTPVFIWGLALGTKYTTVIPFVSYLLVFLLYLLASKVLKVKKLKLTKRKVITILFIFLISGGYWYMKNLVLFGNPIYPFIFPCYGQLAQPCQTGASFFEGWMQPIDLQNARSIFSALMAGSKGLAGLFIVNLLLLIYQKKAKIKKIVLFILLATFIELFIMSRLSGFYIRYHQHLQMILFILLISQLNISLKSFKKPQVLFTIFSAILIAYTTRQIYRTLRFSYSTHYIPSNEVKYALGKEDIYDWIDLKFPRVNKILLHCENPPNSQIVNFSQLDPDLIWFEYDGMMRTFMTNCTYTGRGVDGQPVETAVQYAIDNQYQFIFPSINPCTEPESIRTLGYENENQMYLRKLTNEFVCVSKEILPSLYEFNWQDLKSR
jgi:hypothetical protein